MNSTVQFRFAMPTLLLEIGVEELPASIVDSASHQLLEGVRNAVRDTGLGDAETTASYATPRRLIVVVEGVAERQEDRSERRRGPSVAAAYKDGQPTQALLGFARGAGVDAGAIESEGDYVWANVATTGKPAADAIGEPLAAAVRSISFDKTMRWGAGRTRFSRPIRWIVAMIGNEVVPLSIETVSSGRVSRGHRFLSPEEFQVNPATFLDDLRARFVEPQSDVRRTTILSKAKELSPNAVISDELLHENANLTEWPMPIFGAFRDEFLVLPKSVLVTAMAKHERFFPVEVDGTVTTHFVSVTNSGDPETVQAGNEWVLNARLNDALFFFQEDSRKTLEEFWEATDRIAFQEKLGTVKQRSERLANLTEQIANGYESNISREAGRLAKADLSTGLVSELPSLQGKVGAEYARMQGYPESVCTAIELHYTPSGDDLANAVMCADQADRLAGYLGIGQAPTGSSDPYALRKAATILMQTKGSDIPTWIRFAVNEYEKQGYLLSDFDNELQDLLYGRLQALYTDIPYDALAAAWQDGLHEPTASFLERTRLMANLSSDIGFVRSAKRPGNIVEAAKKKQFAIADRIDPNMHEHAEEKALFEAYLEFEQSDDMERHLANLRRVTPIVDSYFDKVMVMVNDEQLRANRLRLLTNVNELFRRIGDFSKIVIEEE